MSIDVVDWYSFEKFIYIQTVLLYKALIEIKTFIVLESAKTYMEKDLKVLIISRKICYGTLGH